MLIWAIRASAVGRSRPPGTLAEWASFAYLAVVRCSSAFFAWYRGLAIGPMAQVSQVQLVQPVFSIVWAALILHEQLDLGHDRRRTGRRALRRDRRADPAASAAACPAPTRARSRDGP